MNRERNKYNNSSSKVKESWAIGVEWELTRMRYPNYRGGTTHRPNYTQIVVDMIDPNYSKKSSSLNNGLFNDNVTVYTIKQIENVLSYTSSWEDWKNHIKTRYDNRTKNNLYALFNYWY